MSLSKSEKCSRAVMLALGISCVVSGLYYVTRSFTDSRASLINEYTAAVRSYSSEILPFFSSLDIDISCDDGYNERLAKRQEQVTGVCRNSVCDARSDIPSYSSVVYVFANISRDMIGCQLAVTPASIPAPPLKAELPLPKCTLKTEIDLHLNPKMCNNRGGSYQPDGRCVVPGWLKSGCLTISGTSVANMSLGGVAASGSSCDLITAAKSTAVWEYAEFHRPSFSPSLTLRSFKDPYMIAQVITDGTLDFGSTPKDNYSTGVVLLVLGCALFLPQICLCAFRLRTWLQERHRRRYHADLERAADFDLPSEARVGVSSRTVGRSRHETRAVHRSDGGAMAGGGTMVDLSSLTRRPSPRLKPTIVDVSAAATNV